MNAKPNSSAGVREYRATPQERHGLASPFAAFALAALMVFGALGAWSSNLQGSARLVLVTSVLALLSPLFWPGRADTARATAQQAIVWSLAAAVLVVVATLGIGSPRQVASSCVMLFLICAGTLGVAAWIETLLANRIPDTIAARNASAWLATIVLVVTSAAPLWLGPAAELASIERPRALHAVVAVSPLTHLAVASGNDLLRNQWFYQHSNLSGLRFDYPRLAPVLAGYAALLVALILVPVITQRRREPGLNSTSTQESVK